MPVEKDLIESEEESEGRENLEGESDDDSGGSAAAGENGTGKHKAAKDKRWKDMVERTERTEKENGLLRQQMMQHQQAIMRLSMSKQQESTPKPEDDKVAQLQREREEQIELFASLGEMVPVGLHENFKKRIKEYDRQIVREEARSLLAEERQKMPQRNPEQDNIKAAADFIRNSNPDVFRDPKHVQWQSGRVSQLIADGRQVDAVLFQEVADEAREHFKIGNGGSMEPSEAARRKFTGQGSTRVSGKESAMDFDDPQIKGLIEAFGKHLPAEKRKAHFMNTVGKGMMKKASAAK